MANNNFLAANALAFHLHLPESYYFTKNLWGDGKIRITELKLPHFQQKRRNRKFKKSHKH